MNRASSVLGRSRLPRRIVLVGLAGVAGSAILAACGDEAIATVAPTAPATSGMRASTAMPSAVATTAPTAATPMTTIAPTPAASATARPASTTVPVTMPSVVTRRITIDYLHTNGTGGQGMALRENLRQFNALNTGITINEQFIVGYPELIQKLQAAIAARSAPAMAQIGLGYMRYAANTLPHLTIDEVAKRDPQSGEFLKNFTPTTLDLGRVDGVLHGMPYAISVPVVYYNADLFRQAGLERPRRTWAEVRENARAIKERTGKPGIYIDAANNFWTYQAFIEGNGARLLLGSGSDVRCGLDSPEAIEAVQFVADMILKDKSALSATQMQGQASFRSGEVAMNSSSIAQLSTNKQSAKFELGVAPFPLWGSKPRRAPVGGSALFIFGTDPAQQAAAWEWTKFLLSPDALTVWVPGTGYLSPRLGLGEDPKYLKAYYDSNPLIRPALDEVPDMVPWISYPGKNGLQAPVEMFDAVQMVFAGADTASTLRAVTQRVNQIIKE